MTSTSHGESGGSGRARAALTSPRYEILPLPGAIEQCRDLPRGSVVTVTCSPTHGVARTVEYAETISALGLHAVPHIAARMVRDRDTLARILERLARSGIDEVFVVGGDAPSPLGAYTDALELLEDLDRMSPRPSVIGVPAYPEGHALIDSGRLEAALQIKAEVASHAVTQLCFDAAPLLSWLSDARRCGLRLPIHAGLAGVIDRRKLLRLAMRLGLGPSRRLLANQSGLLGAVLTSAHYRADDLVRSLVPVLGDADANLVGLHLYTFNRVRETRTWLDGMNAELGHDDGADGAQEQGILGPGS